MRRAAWIVGGLLALVALGVGSWIAWRLFGGVEAAGGVLGAGLLGGAAARKLARRRRREDVRQAIDAVDAGADQETTEAVEEAATQLEEAKADADALRAGDSNSSADDRFLRDELGAVEWTPDLEG